MHGQRSKNPKTESLAAGVDSLIQRYGVMPLLQAVLERAEDRFLENEAGMPKLVLMALLQRWPLEPLSTALFIAAGGLGQKTTWGGNDFAEHWLHVADINNEAIPFEQRLIGLLHDLVEDGGWTLKDLYRAGFPTRVVEGVDSVTKREGELYLDAMIRASLNKDGSRIKENDNRHNLDSTRSPKPLSNKQKYVYRVSWTYLNAVNKRRDKATGGTAAGISVWRFLSMPEYAELLTAESFPHIVAATSIPPPASVQRKYAPTEPTAPLRPRKASNPEPVM